MRKRFGGRCVRQEIAGQSNIDLSPVKLSKIGNKHKLNEEKNICMCYITIGSRVIMIFYNLKLAPRHFQMHF